MLVHQRYPAWSNWEYYYSSLVGMYVHHRIPSVKSLGVLLLSLILLPTAGMQVHHRVPSIRQLGVSLLPPDEMFVRHRVTSMKQLGVFLLPRGWDASPSQGTQHEESGSIREVVRTNLRRWGPTTFSGRGVIQDITYLVNHMDKIYWP